MLFLRAKFQKNNETLQSKKHAYICSQHPTSPKNTPQNVRISQRKLCSKPQIIHGKFLRDLWILVFQNFLKIVLIGSSSNYLRNTSHGVMANLEKDEACFFCWFLKVVSIISDQSVEQNHVTQISESDPIRRLQKSMKNCPHSSKSSFTHHLVDTHGN